MNESDNSKDNVGAGIAKLLDASKTSSNHKRNRSKSTLGTSAIQETNKTQIEISQETSMMDLINQDKRHE